MSRPTANELFAFAKQLNGQLIPTAGDRARFRVDVIPEGLCYTPASSGKPRKQKRERIELILDRFRQTRSLRPSDYMDVTHHSSYVLGLIRQLIDA